MSTETTKKKIPMLLYAKRIQYFFYYFVSYGFAWSMQFIVIEVYSITKDPLSLGIGLMEVIPAVSYSICWSYCRSKEKKGLLIKCILAFSVISFGLFLLTWPVVEFLRYANFIVYIYFLVSRRISKSFLGPTIFLFILTCS
jgi:hypothetical protein